MVCGSSANFPAKIFKESKMSIITLNCLLLPYEVADRSKLSEGSITTLKISTDETVDQLTSRRTYSCHRKIATS
ncbi:unnamed protein product [Rhizophagus irregularis]|nr:unnamed protein product [Rhizophagus irregularis]